MKSAWTWSGVTCILIVWGADDAGKWIWVPVGIIGACCCGVMRWLCGQDTLPDDDMIDPT